jgi:hypothetical protein
MKRRSYQPVVDVDLLNSVPLGCSYEATNEMR